MLYARSLIRFDVAIVCRHVSRPTVKLFRAAPIELALVWPDVFRISIRGILLGVCSFFLPGSNLCLAPVYLFFYSPNML
jgi:hypothetical protein